MFIRKLEIILKGAGIQYQYYWFAKFPQALKLNIYKPLRTSSTE